VSHVHLFSYLFILVWTYEINFITFVAQIVLDLTIGSSFKLAPIHLNMPYQFLGALPYFLVHLVFFLPKSWNQSFFQRVPSYFYLRIVFRNQDLSTGSVHCY